MVAAAGLVPPQLFCGLCEIPVRFMSGLCENSAKILPDYVKF